MMRTPLTVEIGPPLYYTGYHENHTNSRFYNLLFHRTRFNFIIRYFRKRDQHDFVNGVVGVIRKANGEEYTTNTRIQADGREMAKGGRRER